MPSLLSLLAAQPVRSLARGELLVAEGGPPGDLFVLESGTLAVERDGVRLATVTQPGAPVGEMSLLLGTHHSASVRADSEARVRVLPNASAALDADPALSRQLAALLAARLDATSALLVEMSRTHHGEHEQGLFGRLLDALHLPAIDADYFVVQRSDMFGGDDPGKA